MHRWLVAAALIVALASSAGAGPIQKWRTPDGSLYFGDRPPDGSVLLETIPDDGDSVVDASTSDSLSRAAADGREIMRRRAAERDAVREREAAAAIEQRFDRWDDEPDVVIVTSPVFYPRRRFPPPHDWKDDRSSPRRGKRIAPPVLPSVPRTDVHASRPIPPRRAVVSPWRDARFTR